MPRYDYTCQSCDETKELTHSMFDETEKVCPDCGSPIRKTFHPNAVHFKGTGFSTTDAKKGNFYNEKGKYA